MTGGGGRGLFDEAPTQEMAAERCLSRRSGSWSAQVLPVLGNAALASAAAAQSATAALRNEAFRLLSFELDFWPFSLLTLCAALPSKL